MTDDSKKFTLDTQTADNMLQNIFAAVDAEPNEVPLESLIKKSKFNLFYDNLLIILANIFLAITLVMPLFFDLGSFFLSVDYRSDRELTILTHEVKGDFFVISFEGPALDAAGCYMEDTEGYLTMASDYDAETNTISFPFTAMEEENIYIYDVNGKSLHLLLAPR